MKTRASLQMFLMALFSVLFVSFALSSVALADQVSDMQKSWAKELRALLKSKNTAKDVSVEPVDLSTNALPNDVRTQLEFIADDQAQIWADTILEGDYLAEEAVVLDSVELINMNSVFLGYRITYSSSAVDTSNCDPEANIAACTPGRIVESSLVAPSLDSWIRDARHLAEFVPNKIEFAPVETK